MFVVSYPLFIQPNVSFSRNLLFPAHCNPSDPESLHILTTAYHTLLSAVLSTWSPEPGLSVQAFADFVRDVLNSLPSSSSSSSTAAVFGDYLIDIIWTIDAQLDEVLGELRAQTQENATPKVKEAAEGDKEKLQATVRKLLVRAYLVTLLACSSFPGIWHSQRHVLPGKIRHYRSRECRVDWRQNYD